MNEIMEEYGGILIAFFTGVIVIGVMSGLIHGDGLLGRAILWMGNHAC